MPSMVFMNSQTDTNRVLKVLFWSSGLGFSISSSSMKGCLVLSTISWKAKSLQTFSDAKAGVSEAVRASRAGMLKQLTHPSGLVRRPRRRLPCPPPSSKRLKAKNRPCRYPWYPKKRRATKGQMDQHDSVSIVPTRSEAGRNETRLTLQKA